MEVDEAQTNFSKHSNGKLDSSKIASGSNNILAMGEAGGGGNRLREWQHSSRIIRVSRASGGKDRHSKVWTAKGPRDRRVRLSVATAIQFYDLQDRLGFDQPSKAVEWLIKAASDAISELPSLTSSFPETPRQLSDEKSPALLGANDEQGFDSSAELEMDRDPGLVQTQQHQQQLGSNLSKSSACSSTSETSKGSGGLSFSRTEIRVKARERARERAKEKDSSQPESTTSGVQQQQHVQSSSSFTQLLTSGIGNMSNTGVRSSPPPMSYFGNTGLMGGSSSTRGQIIQLGNSSMHQAMMAPFNVGEDQHQQQQELQHFSFVPDHHLLVPAPSTAPGSSNDHYNLNFSISPSPALATFSNNRGTLQSNSLQSFLPHFQRFSSLPLDGSTLPFFLGAAVDNQHHSAAQFPPGLQLCYGDNGGGLSDQKGKGKS